jgi:hypothetical protein
LEQAVYRYYIVFPNHHQGLRLNKILGELGIRNKIAPTPRAASLGCGISLIVEPEDLERIEQVITDNEVIIEKVVKLPVKTNWQYRGL